MSVKNIKISLCFFIVASVIAAVPAISEEGKEKLHKQFHEAAEMCLKDHSLTEDEMKMLKEHKPAKGGNVDCFLACIYKKLQIVDDSIMLQKDKNIALAKPYMDEEEIKSLTAFLDECVKVNSEPVNDETGCERAQKLYNCMIKNDSMKNRETNKN